MTPRYVALAVLGAAVLVAGVYLFHEVRSTPSAEGATQLRTSRAPDRTDHDRGDDHDDGKTTPVATTGSRPPIAAKADTPTGNGGDSPSLASDDPDGEKANPSIEAVMDRANKAYDHSDFEEAKMIAGKVLSKLPTNIRMMRIMVSASCIDNDIAVAQKWFEQLPKADREQMKVRCDKYGVTFKEPPQ